MDQLLQQIVAGLESGSSYSLIGLAIVVIMKSTDVPNFAMAEMGLVAAFMAWFLSGDPALGGVGWPFWLAIVLALGLRRGVRSHHPVPVGPAPHGTVQSATGRLCLHWIGVRQCVFPQQRGLAHLLRLVSGH